MRHKHIHSIIVKAGELSTTANNLMNSLSQFEDAEGHVFDTKKAIRGTDSSTSKVLSRIHTAGGIIAKFNKATKADLAPLSVLIDFQNAIDKTKTAAEQLISQIENIINNQGGLQSFNYSNFHAQSKNGNNFNLEGHFQTLYNASELFLHKFFSILHIIKPRSMYSFQAAANALTSVIDSGNDQLSSLKASLKKVTVCEESLSEIAQQASSHFEEIKRLKSDSDNDRKTIADYLAQSTQERSSVQAVSEEASKLQSTVKGYQERFDEFQQQLESREKAFTSGTEKLEGLISSFNNQRNEIKNLIHRAEGMLSSVTEATLASNFSKMRDELTSELWWARLAFYVGIAFLTLSAVPLFALVIMPLAVPVLQAWVPEWAFAISDLIENRVDNGWQYLGQVLARISILLPAAWFVSFAAIRHSSLFRLREHYAYKYSMAVAVEGFKQQSPNYEQEIAAMVLDQLAFNPADKLMPSKNIREGRAPGLAGYLLERIRKQNEPPAD